MINVEIPNTKNLDVSSNEYRVKYTVQRILNRLYENDAVLKQIYNQIFSSLAIYEWQHDQEYQYGDVVWFLDNEKELHVLRCNKSPSDDDLSLYVKDKNTFDDFGWKDLNPDVDVLQEYGIQSKIDEYVSKMFKQHSQNVNYHKYGKVSYYDNSENHLSRKVAERDLLNLDVQRSNFFFPYQTVTLKQMSNGSIIDGFCRKYDNGLLEYDIIFRLGYVSFQEIDSEYKISANVLTCNDLDLSLDRTQDKYFNSMTDMNIFTSPDVKKRYETEVGQNIYKNRTDYVNVYSATLNFAECAAVKSIQTYFEYQNTNYSVFCSDMLSQKRDATETALNPSSNAITFCQKQKGSITAVLVTYPNLNNIGYDGTNATSTPLVSNTFHCKIIGKGKSK